ncbi:5843_t:CDS:2 [Rhizophagus irregularis]|nr:5843_t:CDS:2 [Rhizophagus irregularis]
MANSSDFYPDEDFNFEIPDVILEQQIEVPGRAELPEINNKYKRKKPSFTQEYFEKEVNDKGEDIRICNILDGSGIKCGQEYKCGKSRSSTGNLIVHLRDKYNIVSSDDADISKKPRNSKITDFARNHKPHPKHIQKRREEATLKWMLLTNQPLSAVTNEAYKEKMAEFDPSFIIPGEKKIRTIVVKNILRCIQDVSTRWNSLYYAWDRLFFLKDAITQLQADLSTSTDREIKKDGNRLKRLLLTDDEWELLDQLVDLLMPFEEATHEFSGNSYITLSRVIPIIKEMIFDLATEVPSNNDDFLNENTIFGSEALEIQQTDFDDDEVISNITKKKISIKNPLNTVGILEKIKQNIYNALIYYWDIPNDLGLMAALLDPRYKNLDFLDDDEKQRIVQKLRSELGGVKTSTSEPLNNPSTPLNAESSMRSHKEYRQRIAQKYLAVPATSVSSERLFSDAGNLINTKRTSLDTNLAAKMLFLKRNLNTMHAFASEWNDEMSHIEID